MKKKLVISIVFLLFLTGCWGLLELQDVAIVSGVGIDKNNSGEFEITTQTINPLAVKEHLPDAFVVRSNTGITIFDAIRGFIIKAGKKQLWEHVEALIVSSNIATETIIPVTDFLYRDHEPRPNMFCFITKHNPREILEIKSKAGTLPARAMKKALEEQSDLAMAPQVEMHTFIENLLNPLSDSFLPIISKGQEDFQILGTAYFKDDKMVGELTPIETRSFLRVLDEVEGGLQVIHLPTSNGDQNNFASIEIKNSKTSLKAKIEQGEPKIIISIKETGVIGDIIIPFELNSSTTKELEELYAKTIKQEITVVIEKIQKKRSNILRFAEVLSRSEKEYWEKHKEQWDEIYANLTTEVLVECQIIHNQMIRNSLK
ncbi:hypothetical protein BTR23_24085 [Alkalihalophilus pseudofirmus]|nr:hypothetical protein BTR23_24085 [Alkalihalophilus pseudofirmus]